MRRRGRINLALVVCVAALGGIAWWHPGKSKPPPESPLTVLNAETVKSLAVERPGQPTVKLERAGERWWLRSPYNGPAEGGRVHQLLGILSEEGGAALAVAASDRVRFALAPPKATLVADAVRIDFGDSNPLDGRRYVQVKGAVHLVLDIVYPLLIANPAEFLSLALLEPDPK